MMDYSLFDNLLDAIFFVDADKKIIYCNEIAASICGSSVKRLSKGTPFYQIIEFENKEIYLNKDGHVGQNEALDYVEVKFKVLKDEALSGRVQMRIDHYSIGGSKVSQVIMHDVTLEEQLHSKYHAQLEEKEDLIQLLKEAKIELEEYNKNLEAMIAERTKELSKANNMLSAMMDSLGQGFVIIDSDGKCGDIYTKSCKSILECEPAGLKIWDTLSIQPHEVDQIKLWIKAVFIEALPFDSLQELGPKVYDHSEGKYIPLSFFPIRDENGKIQFIVMVATDKTLEFTAKKEMDRQKNHTQMILKIIRNKPQFTSFVSSLPSKIDDLEKIVKSSGRLNVDELLRQLHTLEGETGVFNLEDIANEAKSCQELTNQFISSQMDSPQRDLKDLAVAIKKIKMVYEQFLNENFETFTALKVFESNKLEIDLNVAEEFYKKLVESGLSESILVQFEESFIIPPIQNSFSHFNDVVQLIADKQCKFVNPIDFKGGHLKIKTDGFEGVFDSFVHIFRNIVDHGIESPEEREGLNKPAQGQIRVEIQVENKPDGSILKILISDDGAGINLKLIRDKLSLLHPNLDFYTMDRNKILQYIFYPGFSSRSEVGEFSGRGVGMDAVKTEIEKVQGTIDVDSQEGMGTKFTIKLPLGKDTMIKQRVA